VMIAAMFVDPGDPTRVFKELAEIESARARGRELWAQVGCFPLGMEFTLRHPYPLEAFLAWRPAIRATTEAEYTAVLADPSFRRALKAEAAIPGVPNRFSNQTWPHLTIMEVTRPEHRPLVGRTIAELARERSRDPFDVFLDFGLDGELDAMFDCRLFNTDEDEVRKHWKEEPVVRLRTYLVAAHGWTKADEEALIRETAAEGVVAGYPLSDFKATLYDGSFHTVDSNELSFKIAASMALKEAVHNASPALMEPIMDVKIRVPEEFMGEVNRDLNGRRGRLLGMDADGTTQVISAHVPQAELFSYATELRSITAGRGTFSATLDHYEDVPAHLTERIIKEHKAELEANGH